MINGVPMTDSLNIPPASEHPLEYSDIHVPREDRADLAMGWNGFNHPVFFKENPAMQQWTQKLVEEAIKYQDKHQKGKEIQYGPDARFTVSINFGDENRVKYRVVPSESEAGRCFSFRHLRADLPTLDKLDVPRVWPQILTRRNSQGLYIYSGTFGKAKTTVASSAVLTRLLRFGGFARSAESPPEYDISGIYGKGYCEQSVVKRSYGETLKTLASGFPSIQTCQLFVGEILDPDTAAEALLAATNGLVVHTTFQSQSIPDALQRFVAMASSRLGDKQASALLASAIKAITFQNLTFKQPSTDLTGWQRGTITGDILCVPAGSSKVKSAIHDANWGSLDRLIEEQVLQIDSLVAQGKSATDVVEEIGK
jgi:twitching motility protein PilT